MNKNTKILISGGGTGGHIFPAIAIANELKSKINDIEILFVGAKGRMEMEKVPMAGYKIIGLWISGLQRRLTIKNLLFPFKLISSLLKAKSIINKFSPNVVVGTGGYASGPLLYCASLSKIPTLIHEQNAFPGITNKLLAKNVSKVCVSYSGMEKFFPPDKLKITGNPIRKEILHISVSKKEALNFFGLETDKKTLLIIGGSQGARKINEAILHNIKIVLDMNIQLLWQTGESSFDSIVKNTTEFKNIQVRKFIQRMDMAYSACDFIISRAGAIAIAEIIASKKPAIFIPLPSAAEDHQTKNAMSLVEGNAGIIINENDCINRLPVALENLVNDNELQKRIINNLDSFSYPNAASDIADEVIKLIRDDN
ncbi:MAG: undecaprenyldiphospho-muramoylpentapeptide beta-N-acetylglucosaminyltransferase [Lentimicrobiaceae bacterium]|jgi:UDP-N-acetylglucosamine--N-acetylmuramyl-(pentapeptide) pyrophosphoryl-undecaprenol N-acetylglucosamine transferase|nr:undecaprenyldiphospho-muramoylpentapeptide beta-N-acetylglucosaminyltransferase [Lentimicrobiaceae bacterium]MCP4909319.1 undecaprenyldiphospho-muramoylpentapeptide beta-N-acetylglucosaminyltransferase [Bacteroidota bacterium]MBT3454975.1 undecaprenyldiphospho-muramoylpentapeptide beta-N-acetylglucosaminyltransferase [Lentimicrobiaceae bacterium]MBT3818399.1 undecaprenyldiphospho-muramoylpentapeptide beta-N-acetylglucosaminyltransferase [Lentimicrobiaceae bacterium]MBT4060767.1 undecaprenyld